MDIMQWLVGQPCKNVHSFGSLTYFTESNAPKGAPEYCDESCPEFESCYYNAVKLYLKDEENLWFREAAAKKKVPSNQDVIEALKTTQYGKCVYKCDNNVVDHQVVNLEFEDGAVASFNMCAFNKGGRFIRVMGTNGEIYGDADTNIIEYYSFKTKEKTQICATDKKLSDSIVDGHGGGDIGIVNTLYEYIVNDYEGDQLSEIGISIKNHLIAFAAEKSRQEGRIINLREFEEKLGLK